jgi:hypothetical protein
MNCGLGNLDSLRRHLLPATMQADVSFDPVITDIGKGVARLMDRHCNRAFSYKEGAMRIFGGDRDHYYLDHFPVVIISQVQLRYFRADNWADISGQPLSENDETGLLHFGYTLGIPPIQVQVTWTGGYWFETAEPSDPTYPSTIPLAIQEAQANNPGALPSDAYLLPDDLRLAWLLQSREVWNKIDKTGMGLVDKPDQQTLTGALDLSPQVKGMLQPYIRYQMQ